METALLVKSALIRGLRSFIQYFLITVSTGVANVHDLSTAKALILAAGGAALAFAWRAVIDPLPVPTLVDPAPALAGEEHPLRTSGDVPPGSGGFMTRGPL